MNKCLVCNNTKSQCINFKPIPGDSQLLFEIPKEISSKISFYITKVRDIFNSYKSGIFYMLNYINYWHKRITFMHDFNYTTLSYNIKNSHIMCNIMIKELLMRKNSLCEKIDLYNCEIKDGNTFIFNYVNLFQSRKLINKSNLCSLWY